MRLVGVSGYAHSGKDTIGEILVGLGFLRASFADALREFAVALDPIVKCMDNGPVRLSELLDTIGYERAKLIPEVRRTYQRIGTEAGRRVLGEDIWVNTAMKSLLPGFSFVFTDVRFVNEANAIRARGGQVWRVRRPGCGPANDHISEHALDGYRFDAHLMNDGTIDELGQQVEALLDW